MQDEKYIERVKAIEYFSQGFPRWFGTHSTKVENKNDLTNLINKNISMNHIYISLYTVPVYEIDKIWIDFDGLDKYEDMIKLHHYLMNNDTKHSITFSGMGWHVYIVTFPFMEDTQIMAETLRRAIIWYADTLNIKVDKQTSDLARVVRFPGSFNHKPDRQRFCVPLYADEIEKGIEYHLNLAKSVQRFDMEFIGENPVDMEQFYVPEKKENGVKEEIVYNFGMFEIPPLIKDLLNKKNTIWEREKGYWSRYIICVTLKELGYPKEQVIQMLKENLTQNELKHCLKVEKQIDYIFKRNNKSNHLFMPSAKWLISMNFKLTDEDIRFFNNFYIMKLK